MSVLGIIPARGGSKGVKRKNIRLLCGKPLLQYTAEAALKSKLISRVILSTEDEEIAEVGKKCGLEVPSLRPIKLAKDNTPMVPVIKHAVDSVEISQKQQYKYIILLQPTSPLRTHDDIDNSLKLFLNSNVDSLISINKVHNHPSRMYRLINGQLEQFFEEPKSRLRQDYPTLYERNGAVYIFKQDLLFSENTLIGKVLIPYIMPFHRSVNIDDEIDFHWAEFLIQNIKSNINE